MTLDIWDEGIATPTANDREVCAKLIYSYIKILGEVLCTLRMTIDKRKVD